LKYYRFTPVLKSWFFNSRHFRPQPSILIPIAPIFSSMPKPKPPKPLLMRLFSWLCRLIYAGVVAVILINLFTVITTEDRIHTFAASAPQKTYGIVMGTSRLVEGNPNTHFTVRIRAAAELYRAGKVSKLLLSGDNQSRHYNEPEDMRQALLKENVPDDVMVLDPGGLRSDLTFSRAREIYGVKDCIVVTDDFHLPRCLLLAKHYHIDAHGYYSRSVPWSSSMRSRTREWLARVRMLYDFIKQD
jgi:SanA protein